jgi:hypothetical protein
MLANRPIAQLFASGDNVTFRLKVVNTEYFPEACSFFLIKRLKVDRLAEPHRASKLPSAENFVGRKKRENRMAKKKDF